MGVFPWTKCGVTGLALPPRAQYDAVLDAVVLEYDHYCPFVNNAIGYGNYRYFVLFLAYMVVGCASVAVASIRSLEFITLSWVGGQDKLFSAALASTLVIVSGTLCMATAIGVSSLLAVHVYLISVR